MKPNESISAFLTNERILKPARVGEQSSLRKILQSTIKKNRVLLEKPQLCEYYWDERRFNLHQSDVFMSLPQAIRTKVLVKLSRHSLISSSMIEKGAISYCVRMALMSETLDEKMLFISMGNEEVLHLVEFEQFLTTEMQNAAPTIFTTKINDLIQQHDRETSFLIAQILLEGMSMNHYSVLWESCINDQMKLVIERVLNDEARHHGSGLVLLDESTISTDQLSIMKKVTQEVLPLLIGQKEVLLETIRLTAYENGVELTDENLSAMAQEIKLEQQMRSRVHKVQEGIRKLKNQDLRIALESVTENF